MTQQESPLTLKQIAVEFTEHVLVKVNETWTEEDLKFFLEERFVDLESTYIDKEHLVAKLSWLLLLQFNEHGTPSFLEICCECLDY